MSVPPSSARPGGYENYLGPARPPPPRPLPPPRLLPLPTNGYTFIKYLGSGGFGTTYLAEKEGFEYAVKRLSKENVGQEVNALMYLKDICSMHHILCYHETFDDPSDPGYTYIVTDFKSGKNLKEYINDNDAVIDEEFLDQLCLDILDAIRAAFSLQMTHNDIHPGNIMVSFDGQKYTFTLIDWGISVIGGMEIDLADNMVSDLNEFKGLITDVLKARNVKSYTQKTEVTTLNRIYQLRDTIREYVNESYNGVGKTSKEIQEFTSRVYDAFSQ